MKDFLKFYLSDLIDGLEHIDPDKLTLIADKIVAIKKTAKTIYLMGNGGSSATPSHSAGDWTKELGIKTICLSDNIPLLTSFANDISYESVFKKILETYISEGDLVIAYSGSGNSRNILAAIEFCKSKKIFTIGFTGNYKNGSGGLLAKLADIPLIVNTTSMERIEDMHLIINHIIKEYIKAKFLSSDKEIH